MYIIVVHIQATSLGALIQGEEVLNNSTIQIRFISNIVIMPDELLKFITHLYII